MKPARILVFAVAMLCALAGAARADNVDTLMRDLKSGSDYKVRLSAALSLAKLNNKRAIPAFRRGSRWVFSSSPR